MEDYYYSRQIDFLFQSGSNYSIIILYYLLQLSKLCFVSQNLQT